MIERQHAAQRVRHSDEMLVSTFRASPELISITSLDDGQLVEISDLFERQLGFPRQEVLGRTVTEVGWWAQPEDYERLAGRLRELGSVRDVRLGLRRGSGELGIGWVSAELIQLDDRPCMLAVMHDVTWPGDSDHGPPLPLLVGVDAAVVTLDVAHRIAVWNPGAERLYGWSASQVVGRAAEEVLGAGSVPPAFERDTIAAAQHMDRDRRTVSVQAWWTRLEGSGGKIIGQLLFATPAPEGQNAS